MSLKGRVAVVGCGETPVDRHRVKPGELQTTVPEYVSWAARLALQDAGLTLRDLKGQGLAAIYTTSYPQPFWPQEAAEILGMSPGLLLGGGAGGVTIGMPVQVFFDKVSADVALPKFTPLSQAGP